jgi:hypothetical protein
MRHTHLPGHPSPTPDARLWRHLDLARFVSLLQTGCLFLPRCDRVGDELEDLVTDAELTRLRAEAQQQRESYPSMFEDHLQYIEVLREHMYVSSWSLSETPSAALWGLYAPPRGGIAIQSTFDRLRTCFDGDPRPAAEDGDPDGEAFVATRVDYVDFARHDPETQSTFVPFLRKRLRYEFEHELRLLVFRTPCSRDAAGTLVPDYHHAHAGPDGVVVPIDLARLIEGVLVSPAAPTWFADLVRGLLERFDLADTPVQHVGLRPATSGDWRGMFDRAAGALGTGGVAAA